MKRKLFFGLLIIVLVVLPLFTACAKPAPTTTPTPPTTPTAPTPTKAANWWDKWGTPQYGGTLTFRSEMIDVITEPQDPRSTQFGCWMELLFGDDMKLDRNTYSFTTSFTPAQYHQGWLAESWELTDPLTWTVHLRKGIKWQDKPPVNGREFTAEDVQYSYDRVLGLGEFAGQQPNAFFASLIPSVERVVATDKYTVQFKLKKPSAMAVYEVMGPFLSIAMVPREWVALSKDEQNNWKNVVGTGPFIPTNLVAGTSLTCTRNPNYWGYDERHPQNKLPYLDAIKVVVIPDMSTAIAALRTGKLDMIADDRSHPSVQEAASLAKTNPEIVQVWWPQAAGGVFFKYGVKPFDDIKVRKALQLAIDIKTIAKTHYMGTVEGVPTGMLSPLVGKDWVVPYSEWPKELQDEYSFNPTKAKELLAEAGHPTGFKTDIVAATVDDMTLLQIIKSEFMDIGVDMDINAMDMIQQRTFVQAGKYDQMIFGGGGGATEPPGQTIGAFWSKKFERTGGAGGVSDPKYDALVDKFYAATTEAEAQQIFKEMDRYALEQHWTAKVCPVLSPEVHQPWVKGWNGEHFWGAWGWMYWGRMWIDHDMKASMGH